MSATDGVAMLMNGFNNGLQSVIEARERDRAAAIEEKIYFDNNRDVNTYNDQVHEKNVATLAHWVDYANNMEAQNRKLISELELLRATKKQIQYLEAKVIELSYLKENKSKTHLGNSAWINKSLDNSIEILKNNLTQMNSQLNRKDCEYSVGSKEFSEHMPVLDEMLTNIIKIMHSLEKEISMISMVRIAVKGELKAN